MFNRFAIIIIIFLFAPAAFALDVKRSLFEASSYLEQGLYLEAIGVYHDLKEHSESPEIKAEAIFRIGNIYAHFLRDRQRALREFGLLIKQFPQSEYRARSIYNSGLLLYEMGRDREAREHFRTYLECYPQGNERDVVTFLLDALTRQGPADRPREQPEVFPDHLIRVLVAKDLRQMQISSAERFQLEDRSGRKSILTSASVDLSDNIIVIDGNPTTTEELHIIPDRRALLTVNGRTYRGKLAVKKGAEGLIAINIIPVEDYLYGVVPREMPFRWPLEALKAQAVAARTYAYYQKSRNRERDYDLCATIMTQVYGGASPETEETNRAVEETKGQILTFNGQPILAYYHAHSGGMTEDPKNVWSVDMPYLKSITDPYSMKAPGSDWSLPLDHEFLRQALNRNGFSLGPIEALTPVETSPSGRVTRIKIAHRGGELIMSGNDFRLKVDPKLIRSTLFSLKNDRQITRLEGRGYGHGVGMSQWGAQVMAREGLSYQDILKFYYPGTEIRRLNSREQAK